MIRRWPIIAIVVCLGLLSYGLVRLFHLRFESGDAYPPYSSLRADPLGTMAFYESLDRLPNLSLSRDHTTANRLPDGRDTTYLHLAAPRSGWEWVQAGVFREIERFVHDGGRLVITLHPEGARDYWERPRARELEKAFREDHVYMPEKWGIVMTMTNLPADGKTFSSVQVTNATDLQNPATVDWFSGIVISAPPEWRTIYLRGTNAVLIERRFGRGSVVIATDTYFLSNEALLNDRHPDLLAWIVGPNKTIVFDEAHLGVMENIGVATLMRRYRLFWLVAGFLLLAALFIWQQAFSLVPPMRSAAGPDHIAGRDASSGFLNLLRRTIPVRDLLPACFAEWRKSAASSGRYSRARLQRAEQIFAEAQSSSQSNPIDTYRSIANALETRKPQSKP